jgi:hypothetical protein
VPWARPAVHPSRGPSDPPEATVAELQAEQAAAGAAAAQQRVALRPGSTQGRPLLPHSQPVNRFFWFHSLSPCLSNTSSTVGGPLAAIMLPGVLTALNCSCTASEC